MANVKTLNEIGLGDSIKLFLTHWKYGHNYEDSTVLTDPQGRIIVFYDRKTDNIDVIMADFSHKGGFIIGDDFLYHTDTIIKYKPYDYEMARYKYKEELKRRNQEGISSEGLWDEMSKELKEYNINYFTKVKEQIVLKSELIPVYNLNDNLGN